MDTEDSFYRFQKLTLNLTNRCNLRCAMCMACLGERRELPREQAFGAVDFGERRGFKEIEFTGGEPTLVDYFAELLDRVAHVNARVRVTTNGYRLSDAHIRQMAAHKDLEVMVSVDGIGEPHDLIRGRKGAFEATERNLRAMADAGCRLTVNTTLQAANLHQAVDVYERFKGLGLQWHCFSLVEPDVDRAAAIPPEMRRALRQALLEIQRRSEADGNYTTLSRDIIRSYERRILYPDFIVHPGLGCTAVKHGVTVNFDGYALPCYHYPWKRAPFRHLGEHSLDEIVDSVEYRAEIEHAVGPGGCHGCSTACYLWDDGFFRKSVYPPIRLRMECAWLGFRLHVRSRYPRAFRAISAAKRALLR